MKFLFLYRPTVCVTGRWAGVGFAWEQYKPEAKKMLKNGREAYYAPTFGVGEGQVGRIGRWVAGMLRCVGIG